MQLTRTLSRHSVVAFAIFLGLTVWAFWPSYFARLGEQPTIHFHAHGAVMLAWLFLLVTQALLIRRGANGIHRSLGRLAYALGPLVILVTLNFMHFRLQDIPVTRLPPTAFYFIALIFNALVAFGILLGLALAYRHTPAAHARYMVATLFPLFTPVTDRLIAAHAQPIVALVPRIGSAPILPFAGFVLADLILLVLLILDLRAKRPRYEFAIALTVVLMYHVSVLTFYEFGAWQAFCRWLLQLPLS